MSNKGIFDKLLSEVSLDPRISDGIFQLETNEHMSVFREYLVNKGIQEANVIEFCNSVLEGKFPERQAYNANGILVTFPTPEYKQEAIKAGTHFEKDPTKGQSNLFKGGGTSTGTTPPPKKDKEEPSTKTTSTGTSEPKTNLPISQASPASPADQDAQPVQAMTTAAPQQTSTATTPPPAEPTEPPPPAPKSPAEREMNKDAIKQMLRGDDYMLERVVKWMMYNAPEYLQETVQKKL